MLEGQEGLILPYCMERRAMKKKLHQAEQILDYYDPEWAIDGLKGGAFGEGSGQVDEN